MKNIKKNNRKPNFWLFVTGKEYYLNEDRQERESLNPSNKIQGWWTCSEETKMGDFILMYRKYPKTDIRYLLQAKSDAYRIDEESDNKNWKYGCKYQVLYKYEPQITGQQLKEDSIFKNWKAIKKNFQGKAFPMQEKLWHRFNELVVEKDANYRMFLSELFGDVDYEKVKHASGRDLMYAINATHVLVTRVIQDIKNDRELQSITYGKLAASINFPPPHTGHDFSSRVGDLLSEKIEEILEKIEKKNKSFRGIPKLQSIVKPKKKELPGDGYKKIFPNYDKLGTDEKRAIIKKEYKKIVKFGVTKWEKVSQLVLEKAANENIEIITLEKSENLEKRNEISNSIYSKAETGFQHDQQKKELIEKNAINFVIEHYKAKGWTIADKQRNNVGYDLEARKGQVIRLLEVKGSSGDQDKFQLTNNEYECCKGNSNYLVCLVLRADSKNKQELREFTVDILKKDFEAIPISWNCQRRQH